MRVVAGVEWSVRISRVIRDPVSCRRSTTGIMAVPVPIAVQVPWPVPFFPIQRVGWLCTPVHLLHFKTHLDSLCVLILIDLLLPHSLHKHVDTDTIEGTNDSLFASTISQLEYPGTTVQLGMLSERKIEW